MRIMSAVSIRPATQADIPAITRIYADAVKHGTASFELEPPYDAFEYLCGTSGMAGNLRGQIQEGGNPFEGPRSRPYPNPAQAQPFVAPSQQ